MSFEDVDRAAASAGKPTAVFAWGTTPQQFAECWLPPGKPLAQLLFIHGGCWLNRFDVRHSRAACQAFAAAGFAVWSTEYRRIGDAGGGWPGTFDDASAALAAIVEHTRAQDIPLILAGHSAGGHLALWLGATAFAMNLPCAGVLGLAAICDLHSFGTLETDCARAVAALLGGSPEAYPDRYASASPARLTLHPQTRIVHGMSDAIVPLSQLQSLPGEITQGAQIIEDAGHFDPVYPASPAFAIVLDTLREMAHGSR